TLAVAAFKCERTHKIGRARDKRSSDHGSDDEHAANDEGLRVKAAQAALNVETPRLTPQPPAIDSTCEEIEPLAVVVERQRRRADAMQREGRDIEVSPSGAARILPKPGSNGGNGSDDTAG